jgi:hypothetical protein
MRGLRTTIGLIVVLGGLFAYIYFVTWKQPAETPGPKQEKVFATLEADKIEELQVKPESGDASTLKKDKDGWHLAEPIAAAASDTEVSGITSALSQLEMVRVVDEKAANLNDYGLASPRIEIDFKAAGDKDFRSLLIGQKSPTGGNLFAKRKGDDKVFLIAAFQEQTFNRSTFDLRDKAALHFERDKVDRISIDAAGKGLELAKAGNDWNLTKPIKTASDFSAVEGLIGRLISAQMKSIVSDNASPADLKKYGLDKPAATVKLGSGSSQASLAIGGAAESGSVYARDLSRPAVFTIESSLADELKKDVSEYRQKDLFDARSFNTSRLDITKGGQTSTFEKTKVKGKDGKEEEKWKQTAPTARDVDAAKVEALISAATVGRATGFVDSTANTGLDKPELTVVFKSDEGKEERVSFARTKDAAFAARVGSPGAAKIDASLIDSIVKALGDVK